MASPDHPSSHRLSSPALADPPHPGLAGRAYRCQCGRPVFFNNSRCLVCHTALGYEPGSTKVWPLKPATLAGTWEIWTGRNSGQDPALAGADASPAAAPTFRRCRNLQTPAACNWLIRTDDPWGGTGLCRACRLNRTIPDLNDPAHPDNPLLWGRMEQAKRRLVSVLIALGLPVASRLAEDPEHGLMFDFLRSPGHGQHVMTGHDTGLITISLDEADDAAREALRQSLREPYRTLLGHFRHEVGHYYWDRLVRGSAWMKDFHALFGDETVDYAVALQRNYADERPADWPNRYISAYASIHPWEDWAECWAHYLHMRDTVDTALSFGLNARNLALGFTPFSLDALYQPQHPQAELFLAFLNDWTQLTTLLNELSRAMGQADLYPFVLPREVVAKLHFIHLLVTSRSGQSDCPAPAAQPAPTGGNARA